MKRLVLSILLGLAGAAFAENASPEPVTKLSPYEVRANSVEFKHWLKIGSPHFILYTDARRSDAIAALREFEMVHFAGQVVFGRKAARLGPAIIILPTASSDWRKLESKGAIEWHSAATLAGRRVIDVLVVQYDWQNHGLGTARGAFAILDMERMDIAAPFWFGRGFGLFYEAADFDGDRVVLGRVNPRIWELAHASWLPWDRFFEVNPRSPEFTKEHLVERYEAQAAVFTQYLFAHPDRAWVGRLANWVELLQAGATPTEARFQSVFGCDWKTWQRTLEAYMDGGHHNVFQVKTPAEVNRFAPTEFKLPVREMRELFILVQTLVQDVPESDTSLDALLASGLQSEALREVLTEACLDRGRADAALAQVRQLIAAGSTNPRVYRTGDALLTARAGAFGLDSRLGAELAQVREWDRRGLELEPLYDDLNESLALNEACAPVVDQQSIVAIETCYSRIKGRGPTDRVITALAIALWRMGETTTAAELATKLKADPLVAVRCRELAGELLERIKAAPGANSTPATPERR